MATRTRNTPDPSWEPGDPLYLYGSDVEAVRQLVDVLDDENSWANWLRAVDVAQRDDGYSELRACLACWVSWSGEEGDTCWVCHANVVQEVVVQGTNVLI